MDEERSRKAEDEAKWLNKVLSIVLRSIDVNPFNNLYYYDLKRLYKM